MNVLDFKNKKEKQDKISMITCYDYISAAIVNKSNIDTILVGDSLGMIMHGEESTLPVSTELMALHTKAVKKGAPKKFIVADMPFLSYRKSLSETMSSVELLMKSGANAIKLEGSIGNLDTIKHIVASGVPVMGHIGLTPQSVNQLGGFKVQGKEDQAKKELIKQAKHLEDAGCFSIVLECLPSLLAKEITNTISVPTIGIGAGKDVDGQVLVMHDMLGMNPDFKPKFLKHFLQGNELFSNAFNQYDKEVKEGSFPSKTESYD